MDNFNVPKRVNRCVMNAFFELHPKHENTTFLSFECILRNVQEQLHKGRGCRYENLEKIVKSSLCTLVHLGIVVRSTATGYALRQLLVFGDGTKALPWTTPVPNPSLVRSVNRILDKPGVSQAERQAELRASLESDSCVDVVRPLWNTLDHPQRPVRSDWETLMTPTRTSARRQLPSALPESSPESSR